MGGWVGEVVKRGGPCVGDGDGGEWWGAVGGGALRGAWRGDHSRAFHSVFMLAK